MQGVGSLAQANAAKIRMITAAPSERFRSER